MAASGALFAWLLVAQAAFLQAQQESPLEPRFSFSDSVQVRWVSIPTVVRSERGPVADLEALDFELRIDGRPVAIETLENRTDAPVSVLYLQDLSGSMANREKIERSRRVLDLLLELTRWSDEFALVTFAGTEISMQSPFTPDRELLQQLAAEWRCEGTTGLYDAITWLPDFSLEARRTRRAAVVVTDGVDNASVLAPAVAQETLLRTELPVYVFDLGGLGQAAGGGRETRIDGNSSLPLERLATGTGGGYYRPLSDSQLILACHEAAAELRRQYVLGFAADASRQASQHRVEVTVRRGQKLRIRYRPGYFGPPPAGWP